MTHASLNRVLAVIAMAMLLSVSSVAFAQTDTTYTDGTMQTTSTGAVGGAGDATAPGVPNTGAGQDPLTPTLLVLAAAAVLGGVGYLLMMPRDPVDQL